MLETGLDAKIDENGNIILNNISGYTITINPREKEEVRAFLLDFSAELFKLPLEILSLLENKSAKGANLHLKVQSNKKLLEMENVFEIRLINLSTETSYFNEPFFKISPAFKDEDGKEYDSFLMLQKSSTKVEFPYELKSAEPLDLEYSLHLLQLYKDINTKGAFVQAFVSNTLGEVYSSREYPITSLLAICEPTSSPTTGAFFKRFLKK
ncbi:MAG: hypothetical protein GY810_25405 [Aureispira sp.]|nr:hypothetical protein [Aureispira sp.]